MAIVDEIGDRKKGSKTDYSGFRTTEVRRIPMGQEFGNLMATSHL